MARPQYGAAHRKERAKWARLVEAGGATCCLCGQWIAPGSPWDLDHVPYSTTEYRGAACARCNRSEGAARGNRTRGRGTRWAP